MKKSVWKTFAAQEVSHSVAHYLTTIFDLHTSHGYARVSDVARDLDLTKGSVSVQLKHLKEKGLVTEDENRFLQLTPIGEAVARDVLESRHILVRFLNEILGLERARAEEDACKIEHLLGQDTISSIHALLGFIEDQESGRNGFVERLAEFRRAAAEASARREAQLAATARVAAGDGGNASAADVVEGPGDGI